MHDPLAWHMRQEGWKIVVVVVFLEIIGQTNREGAGQMVNFLIEKQHSKDSCIAASVASLVRYRGLGEVDQRELHELLEERPQKQSGFDALDEALGRLGVACRVVVHRPEVPEPEDLAAWIEALPGARDGFLIAHKVPERMLEGERTSHHITVVFFACEQWFRADPGPGTVTPVTLWSLKFNFSGDLALLLPPVDSN